MNWLNYFTITLFITYFQAIFGIYFAKNSSSSSTNSNLKPLLTCSNETSNFCQFKSCLKDFNLNTTELLFERSYDNSSAYAQLNHQFLNCYGCGNGSIYPIGYFLPSSKVHVQVAIKCSQAVGNLRIVPKGGGHSYAKYSFGDSINSIIIDLQNLTQLKIDPVNRTAEIGSGYLLAPLLYKLWTQDGGNFSIPFGSCLSVGIGFVLGGGHGEFSRIYGLGIDALLEIHMVNANGDELIASQEENSDLFWALRGGGSGSFGIVTNFKFRLYDAPYRVIQGNHSYELQAFPQVFQAWQAFTTSNPSKTLSATMSTTPYANLVTIRVIDVQTEAEYNEFGDTNVVAVLNDFPTPTSPTTISEWEYLDWVLAAGVAEMGGSANINLTSPEDLQYVTRYHFNPSGGLRAKTYYAASLIGNDDINILYQTLQTAPNKCMVVQRLFGDAIDELNRTDTAFVHRNNLYQVDIFYFGSPTAEETIAGVEWMTKYYNTTKVMMNHTESYQNHIDIDLPDYLQRYYGENLERLVQVKRKYDGSNFFHNPQSIPISYDDDYKNGGLASINLGNLKHLWISLLPPTLFVVLIKLV